MAWSTVVRMRPSVRPWWQSWPAPRHLGCTNGSWHRGDFFCCAGFFLRDLGRVTMTYLDISWHILQNILKYLEISWNILTYFEILGLQWFTVGFPRELWRRTARSMRKRLEYECHIMLQSSCIQWRRYKKSRRWKDSKDVSGKSQYGVLEILNIDFQGRWDVTFSHWPPMSPCQDVMIADIIGGFRRAPLWSDMSDSGSIWESMGWKSPHPSSMG